MTKYVYEFCLRCRKETWHRQFNRYGKSDKGRGKGKKGLRRRVTWCLVCQKRTIYKPERKRRVRAVSKEYLK